MKQAITDIHILKEKVVIYFSDKHFSITPNTYTEFNLYLNKKLDESEINKIKQFDEYQKHLNYAINLLSKYAYTHKKLTDKLNKRNVDTNTQKKIIAYLDDHKLLDDRNFALNYALTLLSRHQGPLLIRKRLAQLGINETDIDFAINNLKDKDLKETLLSYLKRLDQQYSRKKIINKREKIISNAIRHGWTNSQIENALTHIKLLPTDYQLALKKDLEKFSRQYDDKTKIIQALKRKGYRYNKIKNIMEEEYDFY